MSQEMIDLTTAAQRLGFSSERTRRAVLTRRLVGERQKGYWFVESDSLERYVQELAEREQHDGAAIGAGTPGGGV